MTNPFRFIWGVTTYILPMVLGALAAWAIRAVSVLLLIIWAPIYGPVWLIWDRVRRFEAWTRSWGG